MSRYFLTENNIALKEKDKNLTHRSNA